MPRCSQCDQLDELWKHSMLYSWYVRLQRSVIVSKGKVIQNMRVITMYMSSTCWHRHIKVIVCIPNSNNHITINVLQVQFAHSLNPTLYWESRLVNIAKILSSTFSLRYDTTDVILTSSTCILCGYRLIHKYNCRVGPLLLW